MDEVESRLYTIRPLLIPEESTRDFSSEGGEWIKYTYSKTQKQNSGSEGTLTVKYLDLKNARGRTEDDL